MVESEFERLIRDPRKRRFFEQERLIGQATELIAQVMQGEAPWLREETGWKGKRTPQESRVAEEDISPSLMEKRWVQNKAQLAERLGKSKAYVTQVLSGSRNMTLRTLADFAFALGFRVELKARPLDMESP